MKKWLIGALVVAAAVVVVIAVTKPWGEKGRPAAALTPEEQALARLKEVSDKAKAASRALKKERDKVRPFDPGNQPGRYPGQASEERPPGAEEGHEEGEDGHEHGEEARKPADLEKHAKAGDVVKASPLGLREGAPARPDPKPDWSAVAPLEWKRLGTLFTGFSIGYKAGGDFTPEVVGDLHGRAVRIRGAVLPIDPPKGGALQRFWLVREAVAEAGCLFCKAPSPGDSIYVDASKSPLKLSAADRENMYMKILPITAVGRFLLGPAKTADGLEYLYGLELKRTE